MPKFVEGIKKLSQELIDKYNNIKNNRGARVPRSRVVVPPIPEDY